MTNLYASPEFRTSAKELGVKAGDTVKVLRHEAHVGGQWRTRGDFEGEVVGFIYDYDENEEGDLIRYVVGVTVNHGEFAEDVSAEAIERL